ncbi:hypothetical protein HPB50_000361 [Hyalomma asiaticum]|uniref:Uncharacterized protein n=1 Tax=Hyalomma asiaticum TaxID=266040 RepID=A0ACB7SA80_HYAAI|nr:hypothetical protein HPB50_000361 [Hyalomma asiaticum]
MPCELLSPLSLSILDLNDGQKLEEGHLCMLKHQLKLRCLKNFSVGLKNTLPLHLGQAPLKRHLKLHRQKNFSVKLRSTSVTPERESLPHDKPPTASEPALEAMEVTTGTPESVTLRDSPKARRKSQDRLKQQKKHPPVMPPATGDDT